MKKKGLIIGGLIIILLAFLSCFLYLYDNKINKIKSNVKYDVELIKCIDGDTVSLKINDSVKKYRFLGIDTPEVNTNDGIKAKKFTCDMLTNAKKIKIEYDNVGNTIDKYNRELVWIYIDEELLQKKILDEGLARVKYIYANYDNLNELYDSEKLAQEKNIGIWYNYNQEVYNNYYTIIFDYTYKSKTINILKNTVIKNIDNPYKYGCRFIGWKNGNYLFDLSTHIKKDYNLVADFDC